MAILKLNAVARITDNGDGSTTATVYNDQAEMLRDFRNYRSVDECSDKDFLNEDDPYENGYIDSSVTIEIDTETGKFKPFSITGG